MCVFAVDSETKSWREMAATPRPSARSLRTSLSRADSCGPLGVSLRRIASARSAAVKDLGETLACRAAAMTSSDGESLATNAEAPASRAPKSCSSPAYIVSTTMPMSALTVRSWRTRSSPVPSGRRTSVTTMSGWCRWDMANPSATEPASATTVKSDVRSKARASPWRISSWSSTRSTESTRVSVMESLSLSARQQVGVLTDRHRDSSPLRPLMSVSFLDPQLRADALRALTHDPESVGVRTAGAQPRPVVLDRDVGEGGPDPAVHPQVLGGGVLAGVGHGLLRDPQELGLHLVAQPAGGLVEGQVHGHPRAGADHAHVVRQCRPEAGR